jgi:hypothetical protein
VDEPEEVVEPLPIGVNADVDDDSAVPFEGRRLEWAIEEALL